MTRDERNAFNGAVLHFGQISQILTIVRQADNVDRIIGDAIALVDTFAEWAGDRLDLSIDS